jgi:dTDP-glucose 4,6-dehydratase
MRRILVTGSFGFIGSNLVRYLLEKYPRYQIIGLDGYTYAAEPTWLHEYLSLNPSSNYDDAICDLRDQKSVEAVFRAFKPTDVIHLAAESHVCRSIDGPRAFFETNVMGTFNLLEAFRTTCGVDKTSRFLHVSTDEVFGELSFDGPKFTEATPLDPRSPYAASKASSDVLVKSFHTTYGINAVITNCSNNFGPNQHKEKLIPRIIHRLMSNQPMTIYGDGSQVRDWLFVDDHCSAIDVVHHSGVPGERYCIGGEMEMSNLQMVQRAHELLTDMFHVELEIVKTNDRPTDDLRYAIDTKKIRSLGWKPNTKEFDSNLRSTINWYLDRMNVRGDLTRREQGQG